MEMFLAPHPMVHIFRNLIVLRECVLMLHQGLSQPEFYGDLVYKLKKMAGSNIFSAQFTFPTIKRLDIT